MTLHLRRVRTLSLLLISFLILGGVASGWFGFDGFFLSFFVGGPLFLMLVAGAGILFTIEGVRIARQKHLPQPNRRIAAAAAPIALLLVLLAAMPAFSAGSSAGSSARFYIKRSAYGDILARIRSGQRPIGESDYRGIRYQVDDGPQLRVAFEGDGLLDNWSGVVFDPSGELRQANGFDERGRFRAPDHITKAFGGDLVRCRSLGHPWYRCYFT